MNLKRLILVTFALGLCAMMTLSTPLAVADGGNPPSQSQVFIDSNNVGHTFSENYFDIMVYNNSNWHSNNASDVSTWLNNTWNVKWIQEGNFQMGMLAFMNKSGVDAYRGPTNITTPAQFWWMHYYINGSEMLIGNMMTAWFGYNDTTGARTFVNGDEIDPFFYFTEQNSYVQNSTLLPGITTSPSQVIVTPLTRTTNPTQINYTWAYNYTNMEFYIPHENLTASPTTFDWGFNYSDPGTYMTGSHIFGIQSYISYQYTLVLDNTTQTANLYSGYQAGPLTNIWNRQNQGDNFTAIPLSNMPNKWVYCLGNWAFIMAGNDPANSYALNQGNNAINTTSSMSGLTKVTAIVNSTPVFNYNFYQNPTYTMHNSSNPAQTTTQNVTYATVAIQNNQNFINLVSGMTQLIGPFGALMCSYAINQTNHFVNGITMDRAQALFNPSGTAAMFITEYPDFGAYQGGEIDHDPVFTAYWTPGSGFGSSGNGSNGGSSPTIDGIPIGIMGLFTLLGVAAIIVKQRKNRVC